MKPSLQGYNSYMDQRDNSYYTTRIHYSQSSLFKWLATAWAKETGTRQVKRREKVQPQYKPPISAPEVLQCEYSLAKHYALHTTLNTVLICDHYTCNTTST